MMSRDVCLGDVLRRRGCSRQRDGVRGGGGEPPHLKTKARQEATSKAIEAVPCDQALRPGSATKAQDTAVVGMKTMTGCVERSLYQSAARSTRDVDWTGERFSSQALRRSSASFGGGGNGLLISAHFTSQLLTINKRYFLIVI